MNYGGRDRERLGDCELELSVLHPYWHNPGAASAECGRSLTSAMALEPVQNGEPFAELHLGEGRRPIGEADFWTEAESRDRNLERGAS